MLNFRCLPCIISEMGDPVFYRCGDILSFSEAEIQSLVSVYNIKIFLDLRSESEVWEKGKPELAIRHGLSWIHVPLKSDKDYFRKKKYPTAVDYYNYSVALLENNKPTFLEIFDIILSDFKGALLFGCYAGKDRTGLLAILILLLYDVDVEQVAADYLATGASLAKRIDYFKDNWIRKGLTRAEYLNRMQPSRETVLMLIEYIQCNYLAAFGRMDGFRKKSLIKKEIL